MGCKADQYLEKAARLGQPVVLPRSVQELWKNFSAGAQEIEAMMRQQEQKKRALALDPEEIAKLPPQVQDKYMKDAQAQAAARLGDLDPTYKSVENLVNKTHRLLVASNWRVVNVHH